MRTLKIIQLLGLILVQSGALAQITQNSSAFLEGFKSGCKRHKDVQVVLQIYGQKKGGEIIEAYCNCRGLFLVNNLSFKNAEDIWLGKVKMDPILFDKMEEKCAKEVESLMK